MYPPSRQRATWWSICYSLYLIYTWDVFIKQARDNRVVYLLFSLFNFYLGCILPAGKGTTDWSICYSLYLIYTWDVSVQQARDNRVVHLLLA